MNIMEQERVMEKGSRVTLETGKHLFQFFAYTLEQIAKKYEERKQMGEQSWKEFNQSPHSKMFREFEESEINFDKLKRELNKSGVRFHFKDNKDGTKQIWFEAINEEVVAAALQKTVKEIVTDPKAAKDKYMKKSNELTPKQQIDKIKQSTKSTGEAVQNKTKGKSI